MPRLSIVPLAPGVRIGLTFTTLYILAYLLGPGPIVQLPLILAFLLISPGILLIDWIDLSDSVVSFSVVTASSLAINILAVTVLVGTGTYNVHNGVISTAGVSMLLLLVSYDKAAKGQHGTGGPGYNVDAEFNDTRHDRGVLSMARASDPNSAGSQFFICVGDSHFLDGQYTAFGRVVRGMEVADAIVSQPRAGRDNPNDRVEMKVRVVE
jgi:hypothetical protein